MSSGSSARKEAKTKTRTASAPSAADQDLVKDTGAAARSAGVRERCYTGDLHLRTGRQVRRECLRGGRRLDHRVPQLVAVGRGEDKAEGRSAVRGDEPAIARICVGDDPADRAITRAQGRYRGETGP